MNFELRSTPATGVTDVPNTLDEAFADMVDVMFVSNESNKDYVVDAFEDKQSHKAESDRIERTGLQKLACVTRAVRVRVFVWRRVLEAVQTEHGVVRCACFEWMKKIGRERGCRAGWASRLKSRAEARTLLL